jgi:hypothetical protein
MSRLTGWVIVVGAAVLIYSLAFTPFSQETDAWESTDSGGLVRITIACPAPVRVLLFGAEPEDPDDAGACDRSSRTLALEAGVVALAASLIVWKPVTRRRPMHIEPLSRQIDV